MKFLLKLIFITLLVCPLLLATGLFMMVEQQPRIERTAKLTPANIAQAKKLLDQHDPRRLKSGSEKRIEINEQELDLALNYLLQRYAKGSGHVDLQPHRATTTASLPLPLVPVSLYLNATAVVGDTAGEPRLRELRIGRVNIPPWAVPWLVRAIGKFTTGEHTFPAVGELIKELRIAPQKLTAVYRWDESLPDRVRAGLLTSDDQARIKSYHDRLVEIARQAASRKLSLVDLFKPLFALARDRSRDHDPAKENRAALLVLTLYVTGEKPGSLIAAAKSWPTPLRREITLNNRDDFAKHFIVSAALAAYADSPLANAVGLYKELDDARGGSGFSFNDIAADRAGTKFGEALVVGAAMGRKLQQQLAQGIREAEVMPTTHDLPEFMQEAEFKRRFGGVGAPAYDAMMARIERRIVALPFYR